MNNKSTISISSIFSGYVAAIPILQYYVSPVGSLNLATLISVIFFFFFIYKTLLNGKFTFEKLVFPVRLYVIFMIFNVIITSKIFNYDFTWDNLGPIVRLVFLYICLIALGCRWFDFKKSFDIMEKLLFLSALFIVIHAVLYSVSGIKVTPIIESLVSKQSLNLDLNRVRTGGFYMEPAHFAQSAFLYICYSLFSTNEKKSHYNKKLLTIIIGLIFSGSGQGYSMLAALYCVWVFKTLYIDRVSITRLTLVMSSILGVFALLLLLLQIPFIQNALSRIIYLDSDVLSFGGQALAGRTYTNHYFHEFSDSMKLTGIGFGHISDITRGGYTNSLYSHLIQCGYPSIFFLAAIIIYYFKKGPFCVKVHCLIYALMIFFSTIANPMALFFTVEYYISLSRNEVLVRKNSKLILNSVNSL